MSVKFRGRFEVRIDDKGRMRMPATLKNTHIKDNQVVITNGQFQGLKCLDLFTLKSWEKLEDKISEFSTLDRHVQNFQRFYLSGAQAVDYDSSGRLLLPPQLRKYAGLDTNIVLVGMGDKIEIWSQSIWNRLYEGLAENFEETLGRLAQLESDRGD